MTPSTQDARATGLVELAERFQTALLRFQPDHDFGIMWEYDDRQAGVVVGPNALAGYPYAKASAKHLDRFEAVVMAVEAAAAASEARALAASTKDQNDDG